MAWSSVLNCRLGVPSPHFTPPLRKFLAVEPEDDRDLTESYGKRDVKVARTTLWLEQSMAYTANSS